jgi:hypothetical protein
MFHSPIIGHPIVNSIVYPVVNLNTGSSSQLLRMMQFTMELETHSLANYQFQYSPVLPGFLKTEFYYIGCITLFNFVFLVQLKKSI